MPAFTDRTADWLSFEEARERILSEVSPGSPTEVPLLEAEGRSLAAEVRARSTLPPGPTSHMDGYAFRSTDLRSAGESTDPPALEVIGRSRPGSPFRDPLPQGTAVRIMTGALLPTGADQVCPVEQSDREGEQEGRVRLRPTPTREGDPPWEPGRHVRPAGEEVREGDSLAAPGDTLGFALCALLAGAGERSVLAHPTPRVAILVTGDELVPLGEANRLEDGLQRIDILSPTLPHLVREAGGHPLVPVQVGDRIEALTEAFSEASAQADLILTTGGASMGETDLVKDALDRLGFELDFWRIRMRPGSPVSFGRLPRADGRGTVPVLGLPGNPVSALVTCMVLGLPAIRALGGHRRRHLPRARARARDAFPGPSRLTRFFRVRLEPEADGAWGAYSPGSQGSGAIRSLALADGLAVVREGEAAPAPGQELDVLFLPGGSWMGMP